MYAVLRLDFLGLEVLNDSCGKATHMGTLDRDFAVVRAKENFGLSKIE